jgi:hypothetical protein
LAETAASSFPWLYRYEEDGPRLDSVVLRPVVDVSFVGAETSPPVRALVDTGCGHVLAAPWIAQTVGVNPSASDRCLLLGIGGQQVSVRFVDLTVRLHAPGQDESVFVEWQTEVGFMKQWRPTWPSLVGQVGFLDQFTVTFNHQAQHLAIEPVSAFDHRFGVPLAP